MGVLRVDSGVGGDVSDGVGGCVGEGVGRVDVGAAVGDVVGADASFFFFYNTNEITTMSKRHE